MKNLWYLVVPLAILSCKTQQAGVTGSDVASTGTSAAINPKDPKDNRSSVGGLMASRDSVPNGMPAFRISGNYPTTPSFSTNPPPDPREILEAKSQADKRQLALQWLKQMQAYIYEDMNDQNKADPNKNFRINSNGSGVSSKRWFHMPWLSSANYKPNNPGRGRDGSWGLTRELDLKGPISWPKAEGKTCVGQDWGVAFFNEPGGYAIGQAFPPGTRVNFNTSTGPGGGFVFPPGTVSFKILFTSADPVQVPAINGAMEIKALINGKGSCQDSNGARVATTMRHVQMDVMMRYGSGKDDWIFGVFIYNKNKRNEYWQGMEPVGVQFGVTKDQTIRVSKDLVPNGFEDRLNGPADNPMSSCFSCHARAQWPEAPAGRLPFAPSSVADRENICILHEWGGEGPGGCRPCGADGCIKKGESPILPGAQTHDYALQLSLAARNRSIIVGGP